MRQATVLFIMIIAVGFHVYAAKIADFEEILKTPFVVVDSKHIVIWDQQLKKIHVYQRQDLKKIKTFGRRGQGPAEFIGISRVSVSEDYIYVSSFPKLCIFTKGGELDEEIKGPTDAGSFIYCDGNFVGVEYLRKRPQDKILTKVFSLYNSDLEKLNKIVRVESNSFSYYEGTREKVFTIRAQTRVDVYKRKIVLGEPDRGGVITIFNHKGEKISGFKIDSKKRPVLERDKQYKLNRLRKFLGEKEWKKRLYMFDYCFPEFYPAFENFAVHNDKIYIIDFLINQKRDIIVYDLKGKRISRKSIPILKHDGCINLNRFDVDNGKLYFMRENEDTEKWELHAIDLEK